MPNVITISQCMHHNIAATVHPPSFTVGLQHKQMPAILDKGRFLLNRGMIYGETCSICLVMCTFCLAVFILLFILMKECRLNRSSDAEMIADRLLSGVPMGKMPVMCRPPSKLLSEPSFQISHFAGMVVYSSAELVDKNKVVALSVWVLSLLIVPLNLEFAAQLTSFDSLFMSTLTSSLELFRSHSVS